MKRVLLMHISKVTGHRRATQAIQEALHEIDKDVQIKDIDGVNYTNPFLEKLVGKLYMTVIGMVPQLWDYLYDNEDVWRRARRARSLMHRLKNRKIRRLLDKFKPDIIVLGYDQAWDKEQLKKRLEKRGLKIQVLRLKKYDDISSTSIKSKIKF